MMVGGISGPHIRIERLTAGQVVVDALIRSVQCDVAHQSTKAVG